MDDNNEQEECDFTHLDINLSKVKEFQKELHPPDHSFIIFRDEVPTWFNILIVLIAIAWSVICAWVIQKLVDDEWIEKIDSENILRVDESGETFKWIYWISDSAGIEWLTATFFTFVAVFRFECCYSRWWEGRRIWGDITAEILKLDQLMNNYVVDKQCRERVYRYTHLFIHICRHTLRHKSVLEDDGARFLLEKGILNVEELEDIANNPSWEPIQALYAIRLLITDAYLQGGDALVLGDNRIAINAQIFRSFDDSISVLHQLIGKAIRLKDAGMPKTYNAVVYLLYMWFFAYCPLPWSINMGWIQPILVTFLSILWSTIIGIAIDLIDPFGDDITDLSLESYCKDIELQLKEASSQKSYNYSFGKVFR